MANADFLAKFQREEAPAVEPVTPAFELVAPEPQDLIPMLTAREIGRRLGLSTSPAFLHELGFTPAGGQKAALYFESAFPAICDALIKRIALAKLNNK